MTTNRRVRKHYIAGPMTGLPDFNYPAFAAAAAKLRAHGLEVLSPHEIDDSSTGKPWDWYMRRGLAQLVQCDRIVLLPGWENSRGARLEQKVAHELGIEAVEYDALICALDYTAETLPGTSARLRHLIAGAAASGVADTAAAAVLDALNTHD